MNVCEKIIRAADGCDAVLLLDPVNRRYACGLPTSDGAVLICRDANIFITDFRYIEVARETCEGFTVIEQSGRLFPILEQLIKERSIKRLGFEEAYVTVRQYEALVNKLGAETIPVSDRIASLRAVKTRAEIDNIVAAQRIAEKAFEDTLSYIKPGRTENEVTAYLEYRMRLHGSEGPSFESIIISGAKTSMPHGVPSDKKIERGDFVTLDFGATKNGYMSDMTRTFAVGECSDEMRRVYETVLEANLRAHAAARPGVSGREIDAVARDYIKEQGYGDNFGHGLGHSVGLEIHEMPSFSPSCAMEINAGNVITIEPGIYLDGRFGVRIEDMVEITKTGSVCLTDAPKELLIL